MAIVDRDRSGVPEDRRAGEQQQAWHQDRADGVDVRQRVQRQATEAERGVVTEAKRHHAVRHLVENDGGEDGERPQGDLVHDVDELIGTLH